MGDFAEARRNCTELKMKSLLGTLSAINGGMLAGGSWRKDLSPESDFEQAYSLAVGTLFKQKGIKKKIEAAVEDCSLALESAEKDEKTFKFTVEEASKQSLKDNIATARATIAEAMFLQLLQGKADKPAASISRISKEAEQLAHLAVDTRLLHAGIWAKVQTIIAADVG